MTAGWCRHPPGRSASNGGPLRLSQIGPWSGCNRDASWALDRRLAARPDRPGAQGTALPPPRGADCGRVTGPTGSRFARGTGFEPVRDARVEPPESMAGSRSVQAASSRSHSPAGGASGRIRLRGRPSPAHRKRRTSGAGCSRGNTKPSSRRGLRPRSEARIRALERWRVPSGLGRSTMHAWLDVTSSSPMASGVTGSGLSRVCLLGSSFAEARRSASGTGCPRGTLKPHSSPAIAAPMGLAGERLRTRPYLPIWPRRLGDTDSRLCPKTPPFPSDP